MKWNNADATLEKLESVLQNTRQIMKIITDAQDADSKLDGVITTAAATQLEATLEGHAAEFTSLGVATRNALLE